MVAIMSGAYGDRGANISGFQVDSCVMGDPSNFSIPHATVVGHQLPQLGLGLGAFSLVASRA